MKKPYVPKAIPMASLDWAALVPRIGLAQAAVARFDGILHAMPNPELLLSPLTTQEAVLSSRIEGTQASLEDVLRYDAAPRADVENKDDIQEVQNYRTAMVKAVGWMKSAGLTVETICRVHKTLMSGVRGEAMTPGRMRTTQNYIGYRGEPIEKAIFIPPAPETLAAALKELNSFMAATHRDVIVQTALAHAQFELLHPFLDGNGRVGRMLIPLLLFAKGLIAHPTFYISEYFEENRPDYYDHLAAISGKDDWQGWIEFFLTAVAEQAELNARRAGAILKLYNDMKTEINEATRSQYALQTLDALFAAPFTSIAEFARTSRIPRRSAERIFEALIENRTLKQVSAAAGRRPGIYVFGKLITITERRKFP